MRQSRLFPVITLTIGIALLFYAIFPHGIGLSEDSISYLSAARSLHQSSEMRDIDGSWFVAWAPLYPLVTAVLKFLPFQVEYALAGLNLLLFSLTVISSWVLITKVLETPFFRVTCLCSIVLSFTIMQVYATALTESMFLVVVNLVLLLLNPKLEIDKEGTWVTYAEWRMKDYVLLGLLCGVAISLRYAGIFLLPAGVLFLYLNFERTAWRKIFISVLIATIPLAIWLGRNWMLTETLTGTRFSAEGLFWKNITVLADTVTSWILPIKIPLLIRVFIFAILWMFLREGIRWTRRKSALMLVLTCYSLFLFISYFIFSMEEPRDRLAAPLFIPFFILLFAGLEKSTEFWADRLRPYVLGLTCLWLLYPVTRVIKHAQLWHNEGVDVYNQPHWRDSQAINWMKEAVLPEIIFSNDAYAVYYFTGKRAIRIPKDIYNNAPQITEAEKTYVVWWKDKGLYSLSKVVNGNQRLHLEKEFDDAFILSVRELKSPN